ncbi:unnamed protein product, partial [Symbiodinium necroappetens]
MRVQQFGDLKGVQASSSPVPISSEESLACRASLPVPISSEESLASRASQDNAEDTLWDPSGFDMPEGVLLPHMRLPPACRRDLETMGEGVWERRLTVPPDGFCMLYTFLAACDPPTWSRLHRSELGFIEDVVAEQKYKEAAQNILMHILMLLRTQGKHEEAARLEAGGHPGDEELGAYSEAFGCAILVTPTDPQAFPVMHGQGPVGFEVEHCLSVDGAGHGAGHFELLRSWLPADWLQRRGFPAVGAQVQDRKRN